jgi:two-component system chemotaxis response regulator CheB
MGWNGYASRAFKLGAYDFIEKPGMRPSKTLFSIRGELEEKMLRVPKMRGPGRGARPRRVKEDPCSGLPDVVAIGASTGGLKAVSGVIRMLDGSCPLSVVVSVHIPAWLTTPFVERLRAGSTMTVRVAGNGEKVRRGCVLVTPGGCHISFVRRRGSVYTRLVKADPVDIYAPSIDRMFASAAKTWGNALVGVVMTGMGSDGKSGVREIKENGGYVLAESRQSSEVFSMPEAAISTGMVDHVLSTREVGAWILRRPVVCRPELA